MFSMHKFEIVTHVVLISNERGWISLRWAEISRDLDALDCLGRRRLPYVHAEVGKANAP